MRQCLPDIGEEEMMRRMGEPEYIDDMRVAQETLDADLRGRSR